ncbi:MAG: hypothetical protein M3421_03135 [Bacteroidota bacterium]|jgi:hypothetical protein|nr:hypothetical protein [Bacteroidota bacterium]
MKYLKNSITTDKDSEFINKGEVMHYNFSLSEKNWHPLNFIPGISLQIHNTTENERVMSLPSLPIGTVSAFGLYTNLTEPGMKRFDSFQILADGIQNSDELIISLNAWINHNRFAQIDWELNPDKAVEYFKIEKSFNKVDFEEIGFVNSENSNYHKVAYSFIDPQPIERVTFYRLKFKRNGLELSSEIVSVYDEGQASWLTLFPNPTDENFIIL